MACSKVQDLTLSQIVRSWYDRNPEFQSCWNRKSFTGQALRLLKTRVANCKKLMSSRAARKSQRANKISTLNLGKATRKGLGFIKSSNIRGDNSHVATPTFRPPISHNEPLLDEGLLTDIDIEDFEEFRKEVNVGINIPQLGSHAFFNESRSGMSAIKAGKMAAHLFESMVEDSKTSSDEDVELQVAIATSERFVQACNESPITAWESAYSFATEQEETNPLTVQERVESSPLLCRGESFNPSVCKVVLAFVAKQGPINRTLARAIDGGLNLAKLTGAAVKTILNVTLNLVSFGLYGLFNQIIEGLPNLWALLTGRRDQIVSFIKSPRQLINTSIDELYRSCLASAGVTLTRTTLRDRLSQELAGLTEEEMTDSQKFQHFMMDDSLLGLFRLWRFRRDFQQRKNFRDSLKEVQEEVRRRDYDPHDLLNRVYFSGTIVNPWYNSSWHDLLKQVCREGVLPEDYEKEFQRYIKRIE